MSSADVRISLADLAGAGVHLRPSQAVAIVRKIADQVARGDLLGVPSAQVIRFTEAGLIAVEGPVAADGPEMPRAAYLLDTLLSGPDAPPHLRASGALRLVIARALGTLDLPAYPSLGAFAEALTRFAASDVASVVRELYATWSAAQQAGTIAGSEGKPDAVHDDPSADVSSEVDGSRLTVSDIRRARRETRLTLNEVSERSRIPAWLLRELEWGYFRNWPAGLYGRTQLVRYARAAGLDDRLVVLTLWPELEAEARRRGTTTVAPQDLQPADPEQVNAAAMLVPVERGDLVTLTPRATARRPYRLAAAVSITALLAVALLPAVWEYWPDRATPAMKPAVEAPAPSAPTQGAPMPSAATPSAPTPGATTPGGPMPSAPTPGASTPTTSSAAAHHRVIEPPGFTEVGAAMFDAEPQGGLVPASHADDMMLRITRVADDGARNYHERVSPDGSRIAFDSDRDGPRGVYVADIDGRNVRRVSGDGFAALPSWSPDSRALLFAGAEPEHPDVWNLWSVDLESGRLRRLTSHETGRPWGGSWFPDGRRVAYTREAALVVLDTDKGDEREFRSPLRARPMRSPAVSPDGRHVIVQVVRDGAWLLDVTDGSMRRVLDDPTAEGFSWAPDGRRVAYHSRRSGGWNVWVKAGP
jgi:Helix-turn-helix domain/WD40-like Beta Propeller Repeat